MKQVVLYHDESAAGGQDATHKIDEALTFRGRSHADDFMPISAVISDGGQASIVHIERGVALGRVVWRAGQLLCLFRN